MTDWTPLFDDGHDPVPGNPDDVEAMQRWLRTMSSEVQSSIRALAHFDISADWRDQAATRFTAGLETLRQDLPKLQASFDRAAWGIWQYANSLREAKAKAQQALNMALEARANVQSAQRARLAAHPGQDTSTSDRLESDGNDLLTRARTLANDAHQDQEHAAAAVIRVLQEAQGLGMQSRSLLGGLWDGITGAATAIWNSPVASFVPGLGEVKGMVATAQWANEHIDEVSQWCTDIGAGLGAVALLIAPIPGLDFLDAVLGPAAITFGGIGLAADTVRATEGRTSAGQVLLSGVLMFGTLGVGKVAMAGAEVARGEEALRAARRLDGMRINFQQSVSELKGVRAFGGNIEGAAQSVRGSLGDMRAATDTAASAEKAKWLHTAEKGEHLGDKLVKTAYAARHPREVANYYVDLHHLSNVSTAVKWARWDFGQRAVGALYGGQQSWAGHHEAPAAH